MWCVLVLPYGCAPNTALWLDKWHFSFIYRSILVLETSLLFQLPETTHFCGLIHSNKLHLLIHELVQSTSTARGAIRKFKVTDYCQACGTHSLAPVFRGSGSESLKPALRGRWSWVKASLVYTATCRPLEFHSWTLSLIKKTRQTNTDTVALFGASYFKLRMRYLR